MELRAVRGMNDILPGEITRWHRLEGTFRRHVELYRYGEVRTPILESTALFRRQIGETTDVVEKEMYSFERHGDELTVRPEGTAGAARAYVEHHVHNKEPITRWYYIGPMFRGERPAKGRYRQFYQAGCEHYGDPGPVADAEMLDLVSSLLPKLGISKTTAYVNSIGSGDTRTRYRDALLQFLLPMRAALSEDSQRRLERNPLRVLDSKDPRDKEAVMRAPSLLEFLSPEDESHWKKLLGALDALGVPYVVDPTLVRGLDYYTRTLFEFRTDVGDLGSQNTLLGGGRYDDMVRGLGGASVPAIGFAMGLERLLTCMPEFSEPKPPVCFIAPMGEASLGKALGLARELRALGVITELEGRGGKIKTMLRRADSIGARLCVILGDGELERGVAAVKDLASATQEDLALDQAARIIADRIANFASTPGATVDTEA